MKPWFFALTDRLLCVTGEKAGQFLHGQFSNAIQDLPPQHGNYNLLLSQKGKVEAEAFVLNTGAGFDVIVPESFFAAVKTHLVKLAPLSRCRVEEVGNVYVWHLVDFEAAARLQLGDSATLPDWPEAARFFRTDRLGEAGCDVLVPQAAQATFGKTLTDSGAREIGPAEVELRRVQHGIAKVGVDAGSSDLPQEAGLERALHFNKGCYLGQEVIARLHFRGHVNRRLMRLAGDGSGFRAGAEILHGGKPVGAVTSVSFDSTAQKTYMLGYVPVKLGSPGVELTVCEKPVTVLGGKVL